MQIRRTRVVITGANRGIGLALTQVAMARGYTVYALCRTASEKLRQTGATIFEQVDVTSQGHLQALVKKLSGVDIDILINNAGILHQETLSSMDFTAVVDQFMVNALGPLRTVTALLPRMSVGAKIVMISSRMGSMADNGSGGYYGYRMSKAALNAAAVSLAQDLVAANIAVGLLHPGFVQTQMVNHAGDISADTAAERLWQRIDGLTLSNSGTFWHSNGEVLPW